MYCLPHLGVPMHSTFLYPRPASVSNRKWELRSVKRYWALLFLLSRGHSSTLGLLSSAAATALDLWEGWSSPSPGKSRIWQSWQKNFSSSGRDANFLNLGDKIQTFHVYAHVEAVGNKTPWQPAGDLLPTTVLFLAEQWSLWLVLGFSGQKPGLRHLQSKEVNLKFAASITCISFLWQLQLIDYNSSEPTFSSSHWKNLQSFLSRQAEQA